MANWKKMAEAFGRAMSDPSTSREGRRLIKTGKRDLTDTRLKTTGDGLRLEPSNPRFDKDVAEAYTRGEMTGIQDDIENIQKGYDREERSKLFDERTEQRTDKTLESEFDKGFEDAIDRRKGKSGINRSYLESRGLSPEEIDQIDTDENRRILIDLLKKNSGTGDVLRNFGED